MINIDSTKIYDEISKIIDLQSSWDCRVKMTPDSDISIPFKIPLWGITEPTHIHVDNHINFIFHGHQGIVLGAAAYPSQ
jgi:hypothetical protein